MNTTLRNVSIAVVLVPVAYALVMLLALLFGWAIAHADTGAPQPASLSPTDIAAWAGLVLGLAVVTLRLIAPRTKATWDDELLARLESLEGVVHGPPTASGARPGAGK